MATDSQLLCNIRVALGQINTTVGDLDGNAKLISDNIKHARDCGADIVVFPELAITGYPPEDLLLRKDFIADNISTLRNIAQHTYGITALVGFVDSDAAGMYNAAAVICDGEICGVYRKSSLCNYRYFDEHRYFQAGRTSGIFKISSATCRISIHGDCLDHADDADIIFDLNASPFYPGQSSDREQQLKRNGRAIIQVNLVGGQDELVFAGGSVVTSEAGETVFRGVPFKQQLAIVDIAVPGDKTARPETSKSACEPTPSAQSVSEVEEIYSALVLGTQDYAYKNGFKEVALGMSGGLDSALVACIAVDAVGADSVHLLIMPSIYSSHDTQSDAELMAEKLGVKHSRVPINALLQAYREPLNTLFGDHPAGIVEENLQARIRGNLLMALANQTGALILNTSNKSETACGYSTLYGDMAGGFSVLKSCPKTLVYRLCEYRNTISSVIPESIISRPPSAELRPDQKDTDSLPPYDVLDPILEAYIQQRLAVHEIVQMGYNEELVRRIIRLVNLSEYKRRQAAPGVLWGWDMKLPMTNAYKEG
ncbi:MAG: NAD+ synthase [Armatimonadota bacterium]